MGRYSIDEAGLLLIRGFEGYVDGVYDDSRGFATCGVGHLLHQSGATSADHREYDGRGWAFYSRLLAGDVQRDALGPMNATLHVGLNQNQINAVASACFNCGPGFIYGTVGRLINERRWAAAADAFLLWDQPPELLPRRRQERALFLRPAKRSVPFPLLLPAERALVVEYDRLHAAHQNPGRQRVLVAAMTGTRKAIWRAAQGVGGWEAANRRVRYTTLLSRTKG